MKTKIFINGIMLLYAVTVVTGLALMIINEIHTLLFAVGLTLLAITCIFDVVVKHFSSSKYKRKSLYVMGACMLVSIPCSYLTLLNIAWITTICEVVYIACLISSIVEGYHLIKEEQKRGLFNF